MRHFELSAEQIQELNESPYEKKFEYYNHSSEKQLNDKCFILEQKLEEVFVEKDQIIKEYKSNENIRKAQLTYIEQLEAQINQLKSQINASKQERDQLNMKLKDKEQIEIQIEEQKSKIQNQLREQQNQMNLMQKELKEYKDKIEQLQEYVQKINIHRDSNKMETEIYRQNIQELETIISNFSTIHDHLIKNYGKNKKMEIKKSQANTLKDIIADILIDKQSNEINSVSQTQQVKENAQQQLQRNLQIDSEERTQESQIIDSILPIQQSQAQKQQQPQLQSSEKESYDQSLGQFYLRPFDLHSYNTSRSHSRSNSRYSKRGSLKTGNVTPMETSFIDQDIRNANNNATELNNIIEYDNPAQQLKIRHMRNNKMNTLIGIMEEKENLKQELNLDTSQGGISCDQQHYTHNHHQDEDEELLSYQDSIYKQKKTADNYKFFNGLEIESSLVYSEVKIHAQPNIVTPVWKPFNFDYQDQQTSIMRSNNQKEDEENEDQKSKQSPDSGIISADRLSFRNPYKRNIETQTQEMYFKCEKQIQTENVIIVTPKRQRKQQQQQMLKREGLRLEYLDNNNDDEEEQYHSDSPKLLDYNDSYQNSRQDSIENNLQSTKHTQGNKELFQETLKKSHRKQVLSLDTTNQRFNQGIRGGQLNQQNTNGISNAGAPQVCCNACQIF